MDGVEVLGVEEIRRQLLDAESTLLAFRLGAERSYLWRLTSEAFESHELGPGARVAELASQAHDLLRRSRHRECRGPLAGVLEKLSQRLLGPVSASLEGRLLLIVADGALHAIPFAALPQPPEGGEAAGEEEARIVASRLEVVHLPSASSVAALRRRSAGRTWGRGVAVIAPASTRPGIYRSPGAKGP